MVHRLTKQLHMLARSLCAVMTAFCLCLSLLVLPAAAAEEETTMAPAETTLDPVADPVAEPVAQPAAEPVADPAAEPIAEPHVDNPYTYVVTIEYGSFQFWYDWGEWDVDKLTYTNDISSKDPAAGTTDGGPGWYGFDGVTNRIGVSYQAVDQGDLSGVPKLQLTLTFEPSATVDSTAMAIDVYNDNSDLLNPRVASSDDSGYLMVGQLSAANSWQTKLGLIEASASSDVVHDFYLSLYGAPKDGENANEPFKSANAVSLGRFIVSIGLQ